MRTVSTTKKLLFVMLTFLSGLFLTGCYNPFLDNEKNAQVYADYYGMDCESSATLDEYVNYWINYTFNGRALFSAEERESIREYNWYYMNSDTADIEGTRVYGLTHHVSKSVWVGNTCKEIINDSLNNKVAYSSVSYTVLHEMIHCTFGASESHGKNFIRKGLSVCDFLHDSGVLSKTLKDSWSKKYLRYSE